MITTFDLDGVIANTDKWFFHLLNILRELTTSATAKQEFVQMELDYYASRPLKHHPGQFMAHDDVGYIITARKPYAEKVTRRWLENHGISLPLLLADHNDEIDWIDYEAASVVAAGAKARIINDLAIHGQGGAVHFDNNPFIVRVLRERGITAVLVGGDRLTGSGATGTR